MRYVLKLEAIGDGFIAYRRHIERHGPRDGRFTKKEADAYRFGNRQKSTWVARIVGEAGGKLDREFVNGDKDYTNASGTGNRGVYFYYALKPGIYEINQRITWNRTERYFARVVDDETFERMSKQEVYDAFDYEEVNVPITSIKVYTRTWPDSPVFDKEVRIYVDAPGRKGCYYLTGNPYEPPGTYEGSITPEEWHMAEELAVWDGKWHTLHRGEIAALMERDVMGEVLKCLKED